MSPYSVIDHYINPGSAAAVVVVVVFVLLLSSETFSPKFEKKIIRIVTKISD